MLKAGDLLGLLLCDGYELDSPYPTAQGGANVPGFGARSRGRAQLINLGWTKTAGATLVNELHFSYLRNANKIGQPTGGVGPSLASQGFVSGAGTLGIVPLNPAAEGIENVALNDFTIGVDVAGERQVNNTYQVTDSLSKVIGPHTLKVGADWHTDQVNINSNSINNGSFVFQGSETGLDFADYLIGVASTYQQGDASGFYIRNKYIGLFAQDSWRLRSNFTLNYGLRWDMLPPWHEKYNQLQTFVLGQQSEVYLGAPLGMVFPGDRGIANTLLHEMEQLLAAPGDCLFSGLDRRLDGSLVRRTWKVQSSRRIRRLLYGIRRSLCRHHECMPALWLRLRQHSRPPVV